MADIIKSTSQAILFEQFNDKALSLNTMLDTTEEEKVETADFALEVKEQLQVTSFKEFLNKFAPTIYEMCINGKFVYTTDEVNARKYGGVPKNVIDNTYYQMLANMYKQKGQSGQSNYEFDDKDLLNMLSPDREVKEAARLRKNFQYVTEKFHEARDNGENPREYWDKIYSYRKEITEKYSQSVIALLPLAIDDVTKKLDVLQAGTSTDGQLQEEAVPQLTSGHWTFDTQGGMQFLPASSSDTTEVLPLASSQHNVGEDIYQMIEADYREYHPGQDENPFIKDLVLAAYSPTAVNNPLQNLKADEVQQAISVLETQKKQYEDVYSDAKNEFIKELSKIIEKLMGVMVFFDHATATGSETDTLESGLIVTNCKPADFVDGRLNAKFKKYINYIGRDLGNDKCWFGILPSVKDKAESAPVTKEDDFDFSQSINIQPDEQKKTKSGDALTLDVAAVLLKDLNEAHIMTAFNLNQGPENTFSQITASYIQDTARMFESRGITYPHAVYAYPNFTLMRERYISITGDTEGSKLTVPAIYIDAAYPAAGMLVASQQLQCLKKRGLGNFIITDRDNMNFVRLDLEDKVVQEHLTTKFNRENVTAWSQSVLNAITDSMFGFSFCGDETAERTQNTYVLTARTLAKMENQKYKPVYRVLMEDFIYALAVPIFKKKRDDIDADLIRGMAKNWTLAADQFSKNPKINLVLKKGEDIGWSKENPNQLTITFNGESEILDNIDIISDDSSNQNK